MPVYLQAIDDPQARHLAAVTAERKAIDLYRARKRRPEVELEEEEPLPGCAPPPSDGTLAGAMAALPPRYREALLLKYYNGYSARPKDTGTDLPFRPLTPGWIPEGSVLDKDRSTVQGHAVLIRLAQARRPSPASTSRQGQASPGPSASTRTNPWKTNCVFG